VLTTQNIKLLNKEHINIKSVSFTKQWASPDNIPSAHSRVLALHFLLHIRWLCQRYIQRRVTQALYTKCKIQWNTQMQSWSHPDHSKYSLC